MPKKAKHVAKKAKTSTGLIVGVAVVLALLIIAAFLLSGFGGPAVKDCGTNEDCLNAYSLNCTLAKGRTIIPSAGGGPEVVLYMEVKGGTTASCSYFIKMENITTLPSMSDVQRQYFTALVGKDMTCKMPVTAFTTFSTNFVSAVDQYCTGSLADLIQGTA